MRTILRDNYTPEMGAYHEVLIIDEIRHKKYLFDCDGVFTDITNPLVASERGDSEDFAASQKWVTDIDDKVDGLAEDLGDEIQARTDADDAIWAEIEEIEMSSDVVDIVGTYAELQQYDTTHLKDNDIIKVLQDETHQNETAYYRWSTATDTFSYVGSEGPYYTESEVDNLLSGKQDTLIAGANIQIAADGKTISATDTTYTAGTGLELNGTEFSVDTTAIQEKLTAGSNVQINDNVISATDTTYSNYTGATSLADGTAGLVPAPLAGDETKFLSGNGQWTTVSQYSLPIASANDLGGIKVGNNLTINSTTGVLDATDTTYTHFTGATSSTDGVQGLVPGPLAGDEDKYLKADGTWATVQTGGNYTAGDGIDISAQDVISATNTGKARVLTTDDYNWPTTGTKTAVALWLLDPGHYCNTNNVVIQTSWNAAPAATASNILVNALSSTNGAKSVIVFKNSDGTGTSYSVSESGQIMYSRNLTTAVYNHLASTDATAALSANQGRVLKNLIDGLVISGAGAPTTSTVGTVGKLYEDTTNGKLYICTDATNPYVWEEVGGATYTAGAHISIDQNNEISATYSDFVGSDGINNGVEGLVPAPNFDDVNKYLKGDGTWAEIVTPTIEYYTTEELNTLWEAA